MEVCKVDYKRIYDNLILKRKTNILNDGYFERHHILPKCLGGTNDKSNIINLTPEEHYLAHQLLVKIHPEHKGLKYALYMMTKAPNERRNNNKLYGWIKKDYLQNRPKSRGMTGRKLSQEHVEKIRKANTGKQLSDETKQKISKTKLGVKMTPEAIKSMNEKRSNNASWVSKQKERKLSEYSKSLISAANNGRTFPTKICPHCKKSGAGPNMTRYHFDNCNQKRPKST